MKKYAYVIFIAVLFLAIFVFLRMSEPNSQQAISFVKKQILREVTHPDAVNFGTVGFFPTPEQQYGSLRGSVCGELSENPDAVAKADLAEKRFIADISVFNRGRSASMSQPVIENGSNTRQLDTLWHQRCR